MKNMDDYNIHDDKIFIRAVSLELDLYKVDP